LGLDDAGPDSGRLEASLTQHVLSSSVARAVVASIPTAALALLAAALIAGGSASVAGLFRIVGVVGWVIIAGVLPPMLLLAARRRSDLVASRSRVLASVPLMALTGTVGFVVLVLHALVLWSNPIEQVVAGVAAAVSLAAFILAARHGAFRRTAMVELLARDGSGTVHVRAEEDGRPLQVEVAVGPRALGSEAEVVISPDSPAITVRGCSRAAELKVSAQRVDRSAGAEALPLSVEVDATGASPVRLADVAGTALLTVEPSGWKILIRSDRADSGAERPPGLAAVLDAEQGSAPGS